MESFVKHVKAHFYYIYFGINLIIFLVSAKFIYDLYNLGIFNNNYKHLLVVGIIAIAVVFILLSVYWILKDKTKHLVVLTILSFLASTGMFYASNMISAVTNSVETITNVVETIDMALVSLADEPLPEEEGLTVESGIGSFDITTIKGADVGILYDETSLTGSKMITDLLSEKGIEVNYTKYDSFVDLIIGLYEGEVSYISLPRDYLGSFSEQEALIDILPLLRTNYITSVEKEKVQNSATLEELTTRPFSVLMIGVDSSLNSQSNADSLILATVNPKTLKVTMTSIPRDSYVPISCQKDNNRDKITHSGAGGTECVVDTVSNLFDIDIDFYVKINFKGIVDLVDAIGGIIIDSPAEFVEQDSSLERGHFTVKVFEGVQNATGEQALAFARHRKGEGFSDFLRQEHQKQVIQGIVTKLMRLESIGNFFKIMEALENNFDTNMTSEQLLGLTEFVFQKISDYNMPDPAKTIDLVNTSIKGYSNTHYHYGMQRLLYFYIPYPSSIEENKNVIHSNLELIEEEHIQSTSIYFSTFYTYERTDWYLKDYNDPRETFEIPDILPNFYVEGYTLETARAWANARGITLYINEVREGESGFSADLPHNHIIGQSLRDQLLVSGVSELTLDVNKLTLNCALSENQVYEECKDLVVNLVGMSFENAKAWASSYGLNLEISLIKMSDERFDASKSGTVSSQSVAAWSTKATEIASIRVEVMDYISFTMPDMLTTPWTQNQIQTWLNNQGVQTYVFNEEYSDTVPKGTIIRSDRKTGDVWYIYSAVSFTISKGPEPTITVPNMITNGWTKAQVDTWAANNDVTIAYADAIYSDTIAKDLVAKLSVLEGAEIKASKTITVTLSKGAVPTVTVPNMNSWTKTQVNTWAQDNGITVTYTSAFSDTIALDTVISFNPAAGTALKVTSPLSVTLSKGPDTTTETTE